MEYKKKKRNTSYGGREGAGDAHGTAGCQHLAVRDLVLEDLTLPVFQVRQQIGNNRSHVDKRPLEYLWFSLPK